MPQVQPSKDRRWKKRGGGIFKKKEEFPGGLVVKDLTLSVPAVVQFDPWTRNFHMPWARPKKKERKGKKPTPKAKPKPHLSPYPTSPGHQTLSTCLLPAFSPWAAVTVTSGHSSPLLPTTQVLVVSRLQPGPPPSSWT